jgi:hypothetical protein
MKQHRESFPPRGLEWRQSLLDGLEFARFPRQSRRSGELMLAFRLLSLLLHQGEQRRRLKTEKALRHVLNISKVSLLAPRG